MVELRKKVGVPLPLEANAAPIGERRVGQIMAYAGSARQLVQDSKSGHLKVYNRDFHQSWCCSHTMALVFVSTIVDAITIVHSAMGCVANLLWRCNSTFLHPKEEVLAGGVKFVPGKLANWYGTNLTEEDVIFGGENKLGETIKMADRKHRPKSIFITNSCSSAIMGDDLEGLVKQIQPEVNAILVPMRCDSIASSCPMYGCEAFGHAVLKYLVREPKKKQKDLINIICGAGTVWEDRLYLTQLLSRAGIRANVVSEYATTEQLQTLSEAALSCTFSPDETDYLMMGLEQKYGVPYLLNEVPFGIAKTEEWLRRVAQFVGKESEIEEVIAEEKASVMPQVEALRQQLQGLRFFVSGGDNAKSMFWPHILVNDFGMNLVGIGFYGWGETSIEPLEELGRVVGNMDFFVHVGDAGSHFEYINHLSKLDLDVGLIHRGPLVSLLKLGHIPVGIIYVERHKLRRSKDATLTMGFKGVVALGNYVARLLKNPAFGKKLSAHVRLPYQESAYEMDASSHFVEEIEEERAV